VVINALWLAALPFSDTPSFRFRRGWWTDYGGCGGPPQNMQLWTSYVHYEHIRNARPDIGRPVAFSRYGGIGHHRYPLLFSGDTFQGRAAVSFQRSISITSAD
jgi:alpha-glucosidase (family GH31 glycosyl hydrolase)